MLDIDELDNGVGYRQTRYLAAGATNPTDVPQLYFDEMVNIKVRTGVPISWLAAVCKRTNFNPNFVSYVDKVCGSNVWTKVRQYGLAGIYSDSNFAVTPDGCSAGWHPTRPWVGCTLISCLCSVAGLSPNLTATWQQNLALAANILRTSADGLQTRCNKVGSWLFVKWQMGCLWNPDQDPNNLECSAQNVPGAIVTETDELLKWQKLYAEKLGEVVIVPGTPGTPGEPGAGVPMWAILGGLGLLGLIGVIGLAGHDERRRQGKYNQPYNPYEPAKYGR